MQVSGSLPDLSWLADAPVFIDSQQIGAFYDAVVGPAFRTVQLQISADQNEQLEKSASGRVSLGLSALFPWLKAGADTEAQGQGQRAPGRPEFVLQPVESATRQLVQLSLHYLVNQQDRICVTARGLRSRSCRHKRQPADDRVHRCPAGTMFLPQAAELENGRVVTFFDPLVKKLKQDGGTLPAAYPESTATDDGKKQRDAHWQWYSRHWNVDKVVKVLEEVVGDGGRPRWIDYRMTFNTGGVLHLHLVAHGDYDTGLFAYNLIRRGQRYGLRIVGSLKSQPALNVLAIYEK